jgi:hypothetical protein
MTAVPIWLVNAWIASWASLAWASLKQTVSGISAPMNMRQLNQRKVIQAADLSPLPTRQKSAGVGRN